MCLRFLRSPPRGIDLGAAWRTSAQSRRCQCVEPETRPARFNCPGSVRLEPRQVGERSVDHRDLPHGRGVVRIDLRDLDLRVSDERLDHAQGSLPRPNCIESRFASLRFGSRSRRRLSSGPARIFIPSPSRSSPRTRFATMRRDARVRDCASTPLRLRSGGAHRAGRAWGPANGVTRPSSREGGGAGVRPHGRRGEGM
jgi:hypothetical protein